MSGGTTDMVSPRHGAAEEAEARCDQALGDALTRRLDQLREPAWMKPLLEAALTQLAGAAVVVDDYAIDYCKIKPRRDINVALSVTFRRLSDNIAVTRCLSSTVFPSAERGRKKFADESRRPVPGALRHRLERDGFVRASVFIEDPALVVRVFPVDPVLSGLDAATGFFRLKFLLGRHLANGRAGGHREPQAIHYDVLHYKPLRTCTLHYDVALTDTTGSGDTEHWHAYGKVYRDQRGARCHELLCAAWNAAVASRGLWRAARPLGHIPQWHLVLQEAVTGRQFRHLFAELTHDDCSAQDLARVRRHLRAIARAVRSMQGAEARLGPTLDFAALMAAQENNLNHLRRTQPGVAEEIARVRRRLLEVEAMSPADALVFAHGDFAHGNVLIDGEQVGIIDFDRAGRAEPAYDVAYFLTHMWSFGVRHPRRQAHIEALCDDFRRDYLAAAPGVSPQRMALYEALDFSAYVLRNFRKQSHQANWLDWARYQIEAAWKRLGVAEARGGAS